MIGTEIQKKSLQKGKKDKKKVWELNWWTMVTKVHVWHCSQNSRCDSNNKTDADVRVRYFIEK